MFHLLFYFFRGIFTLETNRSTIRRAIMKIAVCEDNTKDRQKLCRQLKKALERREVEAGLEEFATAEELLHAARKTYYSIFFLDILLPGMTGMDAALKLRRQGNYAPMVFTTVTNDFLAQSYSVWAAHYLVKPIEDKDVDEALDRSFQALKGEEKTLEIMVSRHSEYVPYSDIYYISGNNRNCLIHTRTGNYNPYCSVQQMDEELEDSRFLHVHRSHVINLDHVVAVLRDRVAMRDDALLPIRRGTAAEVRRAWENRRFEVVSGRE
ncbi:LytR/AlgR family response regulator transcription factor [[Clostridium] hylemonae]|uniref:LytR/AlgR family response regulator transcription factor n=4 Tax=[Clostridium] hylemonae TaxID=89153 RepID=UPI0036F2C827